MSRRTIPPSRAAEGRLLHIIAEVLPDLEPGWAPPRGPVPDGEVRRAAAYHGLAALLALARAETSDGEDQEQLGRHLRILSELGRVGRALEAAHIRWAVVKGPVLSAQVYPRPDLRDYRDLDLLVDPGRLHDALDVLGALGAQVFDHDWRVLTQRRHGQVALRLPGGSALDLHWHLINRVDRRREFDLDVGRLLARTVRVQLGGVSARSLAPEDALVHLCVHSALSGGHRFVWALDVDRWVRAVRPAWEDVLASARGASAELVVAVVLARVRRLLGTPVPRSFTDELAAYAPWRLVVRATDLAVQRLPTGRSGRAVLESTGRTSARSAGKLLLHRSRGRRADKAALGPVVMRPLVDDLQRAAWCSSAASEGRTIG